MNYAHWELAWKEGLFLEEGGRVAAAWKGGRIMERMEIKMRRSKW